MAGMKALLVFCDVEFPVSVEVPGEMNGSKLDDCLGHLLSPGPATLTDVAEQDS